MQGLLGVKLKKINGSYEMFVGKIKYVHANKEIVDEKGIIDYSKIELI